MQGDRDWLIELWGQTRRRHQLAGGWLAFCAWLLLKVVEAHHSSIAVVAEFFTLMSDAML